MIKNCFFILLVILNVSVVFARLPESKSINNFVKLENGYGGQVDMSELLAAEKKVESMDLKSEEEKLAQIIIQINPWGTFNPWMPPIFQQRVFVCYARSINGGLFYGTGAFPMENALNFCAMATGWACFSAGCAWQ